MQKEMRKYEEVEKFIYIEIDKVTAVTLIHEMQRNYEEKK
jgi:hypothetical protein